MENIGSLLIMMIVINICTHVKHANFAKLAIFLVNNNLFWVQKHVILSYKKDWC